ncbi:hypothetical protein NDU88_007873 [Pleurodeles waltl]|uniref:Uncharacterized protein n=1 Tax=Pleurodeles waltl TaxID=8319 RepID=A0AAV7STJ8_PLEWA|nr:hypothetical protein NDU88_007873 [Pleurodeles waltl]
MSESERSIVRVCFQFVCKDKLGAVIKRLNHEGIRTLNLLIRSQTPLPLGRMVTDSNMFVCFMLRCSWDPERRGWQPKDKNTRTERRAEKRSMRIRSRLKKRRNAGSAAEKRRRRKRDRRIDARSRRNDAQHR